MNSKLSSGREKMSLKFEMYRKLASNDNNFVIFRNVLEKKNKTNAGPIDMASLSRFDSIIFVSGMFFSPSLLFDANKIDGV